jgi:hypothetical protein
LTGRRLAGLVWLLLAGSAALKLLARLKQARPAPPPTIATPTPVSSPPAPSVALTRPPVSRAALPAAALGIALVLYSAAGSGIGRVAAAEVVDGPVVVTTPINFGVVAPGQVVTTQADGSPANFSVCLSDEATATDYSIELAAPADGSQDIRGYLLIQRSAGEDDAEPDGTADGRAGDLQAAGSLDEALGDGCDTWEATLFAPLCAEAYNPNTDPDDGEAGTVACEFDDNGSADPQSWETRADLGATIMGVTDPGGPGNEEAGLIAEALPLAGSGGEEDGGGYGGIATLIVGLGLILASAVALGTQELSGRARR